jgi:hypothetical protein
MMVIIITFTVLMTILLVVIGLPLFLIWVISNAIQASQYRALVRASSGANTGYTVVYKTGRKTERADLNGATEGEAMLDLVKKNISYDKIISLTKN